MLSQRVPAITSNEPFERIDDFAICPIDQFPWAQNDFRPESEARIAYTPGKALYLQLSSNEGAFQALRTDCDHHNGQVHLDSCLEFFVDFAPQQTEGYLNFEFNPKGFLHLKLGQSRRDRQAQDPHTYGQFHITTDLDVNPEGKAELGWWRIRFVIPEDFVKALYGPKAALVEGHRFNGNFYKCGDATEFEHYALWSPTAAETPDFHRPEYFGEFILD